MTQRPHISEEDLHAFIDGELDRVRATEIGMLAQIDAELAGRIAAFRADIDAINRVYGPLIDQPVPPAWPAAIRRGRSWTARPGARRGALAMAAGLAAVVVGTTVMRWTGDGDDPLIADALAARDRPPTPVPGGADALAAAAEQAVRQALGDAVRPPAMDALGFALAGFDAGDGVGPRLVRLDYRDARGRLFTVVLRASTGVERFEMIRRGATRICVWQDDVLGAVMLADVSAGEMLRLASLAYNGLHA
ncbi:MAG: hypothetical protein SFV21_18020 [Rhodospirillaceae bacterium]|nr:hypothetical protein [Rhodospirillaceae bacterium]